MKPHRWAFVDQNTERIGAVEGYDAWVGKVTVAQDIFAQPPAAYQTTKVQGVEGHERVTTGLT